MVKTKKDQTFWFPIRYVLFIYHYRPANKSRDLFSTAAFPNRCDSESGIEIKHGVSAEIFWEGHCKICILGNESGGGDGSGGGGGCSQCVTSQRSFILCSLNS